MVMIIIYSNSKLSTMVAMEFAAFWKNFFLTLFYNVHKTPNDEIVRHHLNKQKEQNMKN